MKKIVSIIMVVALSMALVMCFASCSTKDKKSGIEGAEALVELPKGTTLCVGGQMFINNVQETETDAYLTYTSKVVYSLNRVYLYSHENVPNGYFRASETSNYYYYWTKQEITEQALLGKKTVTIETKYSYLPCAEGEMVIVKTEKNTKTTCDYEGGLIEKDISYEIDLNGYFVSVDDMTTKIPDLAFAAYTGNESDKYYVDVTIPNTTTYSTNTYTNTYYYTITEK